MSRRSQFKLGHVCLKIGSGATPRGGESVYLTNGAYSLIRSQNVHNEGFERNGLAFISEEHAQQLANVEVMPKDVLLNITGDSVARCCQVPDEVLPARVNQHVAIIRPDPRVLDPTFLRYVLVSQPMQQMMLSWGGSGGTRNALTKGMIESFEIDAPEDVKEQRAIVRILGALDDKIELNRRMNETLEGIARAIFKSWFVDFDPVHAKAEGRPTGLPPEVDALFPDSLGETKLPLGWTTQCLDDLALLILGGDWGAEFPSQMAAKKAYCIRGADIPDLQTGGTGKMPLRHLKESSLDRRSLLDGDLVVEISGGSPTQSTGRVVFLHRTLLDRLDYPVVCSNFCRLIKVRDREAAEYVYYWLRSLYDSDTFLQFENGTTGIKNLAFTLFSANYPLVVPSSPVLAVFRVVVAALMDKQFANAAQSAILAQLRDTLLPKLISGELRVPEAESMLAEAPE